MKVVKKDAPIVKGGPIVEASVAEDSGATPSMAEAANEGVEGDGVIKHPTAAEPEEALQKREPTVAEIAQHRRMMVNQNTIKQEDKMRELIKKMTEEEVNLQSFSYGPDDTVTLSGTLFAHLINFTAAVKGHNDNLREILIQVLDAGDSLSSAAIDFQVALTTLHIENCENGIAKSPEVVAAENAKENIKEVVAEGDPVLQGTGSRVKARGTDEEIVAEKVAEEEE